MSYKEIRGNIFNSKAHAIGNTVNCVGVMGKGIALEFRRRFPNMFLSYRMDCENKKLLPGRVYYYPTDKRFILNITTKDDWKYPSKLEWVESALEQLTKEYWQKDIKSLALPLLGAESGKLDETKVKQLMRSYLQNLSDIDIEVYDFDPKASDPLFEKLKILSQLPNSEFKLITMGFQPIKVNDIFQTIKNQKVTSLFMLSQTGLISNKLMDKLYKYLIQMETELGNPKQLTMLD
jgi:O-acetyl-ADP-ribose deacetylase (regulator of RNase III)